MNDPLPASPHDPGRQPRLPRLARPEQEHPPPDPPGPDLRRHLVDEALLSEQLRDAIEAALRGRRGRSFRWNELDAQATTVLGEVARRALDRLPTFDPSRTLALPWLMGFAVNVMREDDRWQARDAARSVRESSCTPEQWAALLGQLSVEPAEVEEPGPVWAALARLSPEHQRVLRLRYVDDRPYAEIAQTLGVSEVAARMRGSRALQALRGQFAAETGPETKGDVP